MKATDEFKEIQALQNKIAEIKGRLGTKASRAIEALPDRVRELRIKRGMSQGELAQRIGVGRTQMTNMEAGRCNITLHRFVEICIALNIGADQLLEWDAQ